VSRKLKHIELKFNIVSGKTAVPSVASASARGWLQLAFALRAAVCVRLTVNLSAIDHGLNLLVLRG